MKLAVTTSLVTPQNSPFPLTEKEAMLRLCEGGFKYLDYGLSREFQHAKVRENSVFVHGDWRKWCEEIRQAVEDKGTTFIQTHCVFPNYFADDEYNKWLTAQAELCYEATALIGAPVTVMHPIAPPGMEYDREGSKIANRDYFRKQADIAAKYGVKIAVENMLSNRLFDGGLTKRCCTTTEELIEQVEAIDHENVGICIDVAHTHYMKEDVGDALRMCKKHLISLHMSDNDTFNDCHVTPYNCNLDWEKVYAAINEIGYKGGGMLEIHACPNMDEDIQMDAIRYLAKLAVWMQKRMGGE